MIAVRDIVNDRTPEKVAMTITADSTRSVFDRYHIVAPEDLRAAAAGSRAGPRASGGVMTDNFLLQSGHAACNGAS